MDRPKYQPPIAPEFKIDSSDSLREAAKTIYSSESIHNLLLASLAPKTQTNYNPYSRKWLKCCTKEGISVPYMASSDQAMSFHPTCSFRKNKVMVQLQLYALPLQLLCQKLMDKHWGQMTALGEWWRNILPLSKFTKIFSNLQPWYHSSVYRFITWKQSIIHGSSY